MRNLIRDYYLNKQTNSMELYKLKGWFRCKVVDVYDGDTCTIILKNKGSYEKHKLRMYGYDSPEIKPRLNTPNREHVIRKAIEARDFLRNLILNKIVDFESMGYDKYGRLLGKLYIQTCGINKDINCIMLANNHGYEYKGGTKR